MLYLILGVVLWVVPHLFKRAMPEARARMGNAAKGLVTLASFAALGLMIYGYRSADFITVWTPPTWATHINNLLMLIAVFFFTLAHSKGKLRARFRHPMLISVKIWATAHLLVNGDLASIILFGSMLAWAVVSVIMINRAEPWVPKTPGPAKRDLVTPAIALVAFVVFPGIHMALGVSPFPG